MINTTLVVHVQEILQDTQRGTLGGSEHLNTAK